MAKIEPSSGPRQADVVLTPDGSYLTPPHVFCPSCRNGVEATAEKIDAYFDAQGVSCPNCSANLDWWETVLDSMREGFAGSYVPLAAIGANMLAFPIELRPDSEFLLRVSDHGVPDDAHVLEIWYTPQGKGLFPIEIHGNRPARDRVPREVNLYPRPSPPGETPVPTTVMVVVLWVDISQEHELWRQLVIAFESFAAGRLSAAILPANVAVEARLFRIVAEILEKTASRDRVERFLKDGASYGHQLNVLLPALVHGHPVPAMADHIRGSLNRLRKLRNDLAHSAKFTIEPDRDEVATVLCAALFGFRYLGLVEKSLALSQ
jgi:hypothetical protein